MAKLLPYESYTIESPLSTDQLLLKLLQNTLTAEEYVSESDKRSFSFGLKGWSKYYWGYIRNDNFEIVRLITYRNPGNPRIFGVLRPISNGTAIQIKMRPEGAIMVFLGVALLICLYALGFSIFQSIKADEMHNGVTVARSLFILTYFFLLVSFKAEAIKSKQFLSDLFEKSQSQLMTVANTGLLK